MTTETQVAANDAIKPVKVTLQEIVLEAIRGFGPIGATSDDVMYSLSSLTYGQNSITTRYKDLAAKGKICYGIQTRAGKSGRKQRVMFATEFAGSCAVPERTLSDEAKLVISMY